MLENQTGLQRRNRAALRKPATPAADNDAAGDNQDEPATVLITRQPKPGREAELEAVIEDLGEAVGKSPGFMGMDVVRPTENGAKEFHIVLRFKSRNSLASWENSPQCKQLIARADRLTEPQSKRVERVNGLEAWFALPGRDGGATIPKWKTAIISMIGIYPLVLFLPELIKPLTSQFPKWFGTLIQVIVLSVLMTWVMMPLITRILKSWLYPPREI